jgi:hypothetical protein
MGILCEYTVMGYKKEWKYHGNITNNMVTFMAVPAYPLLCLPFFYWLVDVNSQLDQLDLEIHIYNYITKCPIFFCMDCLA